MIIKINSLQALAKIIECAVADLKCRVIAGPASKDKQKRFPNVSIIPGRFTYNPMQAWSKDFVTGLELEAGPNTPVFNVGDWTGTLTIRVGAKTPYQRYELENRIEQIFLGSTTGVSIDRPDIGKTMRPGVLLVDVPECYYARCAFALEGTSWDDQKAFENDWYSVLRVNAVLPALVCEGPIYNMDIIELSLTEDLDTVVTAGGPLPDDSETTVIDINTL